MKTKELTNVEYYTSGTVEIHFPNGELKCYYCPLCDYEQGFRRYNCKRTGEIIRDPHTGLGGECPINFTEVENEKR